MKTRITSLPEEIIRLVAVALSHDQSSSPAIIHGTCVAGYSCPPKDLLNMALSCKYLFDIVYPVLWRTVVIRHSESLSPLPQNLLELRNLIINQSSQNFVSLSNHGAQNVDMSTFSNVHQHHIDTSQGYIIQPTPNTTHQHSTGSFHYDLPQHSSSSNEAFATHDPESSNYSYYSYYHGTSSHRGFSAIPNSSATWPSSNSQPITNPNNTYLFPGTHSRDFQSPIPHVSSQTVSSTDPRCQLVLFRWPDRWLYSPKASNLTSSPTDSYSRSIPHGHMDLTTSLEDGFTGSRRRRNKTSKHSDRDSVSGRPQSHGSSKHSASSLQDNSDMIPQYVINGPKFIESYLNGTATQACLDSIRKIKIPLDGTVDSIFGEDFDISRLQSEHLKSLVNLQFVEICDEPGFQDVSAKLEALAGNNNNNNNNNNENRRVNIMDIQEIVNQDSFEMENESTSSLPGVSPTSSLDEDYFTEQGRVASFLNCVTTEYTRVHLSSTVVSTLTKLSSFDLLQRIHILDIAVQFYELPRDEPDFGNDDTQNDMEPLAIKVSDEGIWFLDVALRQMCNLETLALTDRIITSPNRANNLELNDDNPPVVEGQFIHSQLTPENVSSRIGSTIVPYWQSLISNSNSTNTPLSNLKELTLPNCFCQFIIPDLIPPSVEVLTLNTFFPALFTSRFITFPPPSSSTAPEPCANTLCTRKVSKLALNVGYEGIKLAFPQALASNSNSTAASAAAAVQVIPATPNESGSESSSQPVSRVDSRSSTTNTQDPQSAAPICKPWTSELTALQIWMPPWFQNNSASVSASTSVFARNQRDDEDDNNDAGDGNNQNLNDLEPNPNVANNANPLSNDSNLFPSNPELSAAANAARNIPRGRVSLGDVFLQQITIPLLTPKLVYLVLSSLPPSLLESLPDYCPKLEVLLVENWDYCSQNPVSGVINSSNYHVYYTDDTEKQLNGDNNITRNNDGEPDDEMRKSYSDEYDDYNEDDQSEYEDDDDDDDHESVYIGTVDYVNKKLDDFLAAATASGNTDLPNTFEVYQTLRRQFSNTQQPFGVFSLDYDGYNAISESINALDIIKSLFASENDDEEGNYGDDMDIGEEANAPTEMGYAASVTQHDLANAFAVSDTAAAMFLSMARVNYLSESQIAELSLNTENLHILPGDTFALSSANQSVTIPLITPQEESRSQSASAQPSLASAPSHTDSVDAFQSGEFEFPSASLSHKRPRDNHLAESVRDTNASRSLLVNEDNGDPVAPSDAGNTREPGEPAAKRPRYSVRHKSIKQHTEFLNTLSLNIRFVWANSKSIEQFLEQVSGEGLISSSSSSTLSRASSLKSGFGNGLLRKGKLRIKGTTKQQEFNSWLNARFKVPSLGRRLVSETVGSLGSSPSSSFQGSRTLNARTPRTDNQLQDRDSPSSGEFPSPTFERSSLSSARGGRSSAADQATSALASAAALASAEAYDRTQLQNAQDQHALVQLNHSLINLVKKCGKTLQFVYLPIDPNTIHAATLSFMVCYCILAQRKEKKQQYQKESPSSSDGENKASIGNNGFGDSFTAEGSAGLKLYLKYPVRQPAKLINTGMGLSEEDLETSSPVSAHFFSGSDNSSESIKLHSRRGSISSTFQPLAGPGANSGAEDLGDYNSTPSQGLGNTINGSINMDDKMDTGDLTGSGDSFSNAQNNRTIPRFPLTDEQLKACVERGTGMSPELFKEMSQSLYKAYSAPPPFTGITGSEGDDISLENETSDYFSRISATGSSSSNCFATISNKEIENTFGMAKLLAATKPKLTPLESCSVSSSFSSCLPSQIWFGHRRHQSLGSTVSVGGTAGSASGSLVGSSSMASAFGSSNVDERESGEYYGRSNTEQDVNTSFHRHRHHRRPHQSNLSQNNTSGVESDDAAGASRAKGKNIIFDGNSAFKNETGGEIPAEASSTSAEAMEVSSAAIAAVASQSKVQHESYPLFKVYEYLVKTRSPSLNNCIYRVTI